MLRYCTDDGDKDLSRQRHGRTKGVYWGLLGSIGVNWGQLGSMEAVES